MARPTPEERAATVRKHWRWYLVFFAIVLGLGLWASNWAAIAGGVIGFAWVGWILSQREAE